MAGFSIGLLIDCLLLETMGAFALTMLCVGYVAGRYRESVGRPTRAAVVLLGGALTLLGAARDRGDPDRHRDRRDVSFLVVRDALVKSLLGAVLAIPVFWSSDWCCGRRWWRSAAATRRTPAPRPVESG